MSHTDTLERQRVAFRLARQMHEGIAIGAGRHALHVDDVSATASALLALEDVDLPLLQEVYQVQAFNGTPEPRHVPMERLVAAYREARTALNGVA